MPTKTKKTSSKTELFWSRFEKSGSIQAYLKFHASRQKAAEPAPKASKVAGRSKKSAR
jgi:hypothetical protein